MERAGYLISTSAGVSIRDTVDLDALNTYQHTARLVQGASVLSGATVNTVFEPVPMDVDGYFIPNYFDTFYNQILIIPAFIDLGAVSHAQNINVSVWNAYSTAKQCLRIETESTAGVSISGPALPVKFNHLETKRWTVSVTADGPAEINCTVTWYFADVAPVSFRLVGSRNQSWTLSPDWSDGITETLEWKTDVLTSRSGAEQRIARRISPRRTFEILVSAAGAERQILERMIWQNGAMRWQLPVWPDATPMAESAAAGSAEIRLDTAGRDFVPGMQIQLKSGPQRGVAQILRVEPDAIVLNAPLPADWRRGALVTPQRSAVLTDPPALTRHSDGVIRAQMRFRVTEGQQPVTEHGMPEYRGFPVLAVNSCWSEDLSAEFQRLLQIVDNGSGVPSVVDVAGRPFGVQSHRFTMNGQQEQARMRQLLGWLRGRQRAVWVASQASDFYPVSNISGNYFDAQSNGFSADGPQSGRQDIQIELTGGRIYYRRITAAASLSDAERLAFDGDSIKSEQKEIMKISFLTLCRLNSDVVSWEHKTDAAGVAVVDVNFVGLRDELE